VAETGAPKPAPKPSSRPAKQPPGGGPPEHQTSGPGVPAPPPWWRTLRANPPLGSRVAIGLGFIAVIVFLWWFVTRGAPTEAIISPSKLPSPGAVLRSVPKLEDHVFEGIVATLERVLLGVVLAAMAGVVLGVIAGANRAVSSALAPLVIFLRSIPMGALLPLMIMAFGTDEKQKTMFIFFAIVPFVFSDSVKAISIVPDRYIETAQTLGASRRQIVLKVLVPLALPDIVTSLRFQFGLALGYVMLAEELNAPSGLGNMLNVFQHRGETEQIYALLFVIAVLAFMIDFLIRFFQRGIFQWRRDL
jgi:ABC-type nitrate/sulfonate/bicarbonate transport system permease component